MIGDTRRTAAHAHVCWSYNDQATFDSRAWNFLAEGLTAGARVWYVTAGRPESIIERLSGFRGFQNVYRQGAINIVSVMSTYSDNFVVDPAAQVAAYSAATEAALAAGYTGLRVVAEATPLVRTPAQLEAFTRYEHLIDQYMLARPMSAMCGYDRREVSDQTIAELACMHPETNADEVLFRLYACDPDDGCATLAGELDPSNHELFATALERADLRPVDGELVVRAPHLRFIDHRSLRHLQEYALRRSATAVLRTSGAAAARLVELLDLPGVRVEAAR